MRKYDNANHDLKLYNVYHPMYMLLDNHLLFTLDHWIFLNVLKLVTQFINFKIIDVCLLVNS